MNIVFNEHEYAKELIESESANDTSFSALSRMARYYIDKEYTKKQVRKELELYLARSKSDMNASQTSQKIEDALKYAYKHSALKIDSIIITKPEMQRIDSLNSQPLRRLAFTLLCLAKYFDAYNCSDEHWVWSNSCDVMKMANIHVSTKQQCLMYHTLRKDGFISFSKKVDSVNTRVCFIQEGDAALVVSDFRNLGYQYLKYHGTPCFECCNCGITLKYKDMRKGRKPKYCEECAEIIQAKQSVEAVNRQRKNSKIICKNFEPVIKNEVPQSGSAKGF